MDSGTTSSVIAFGAYLVVVLVMGAWFWRQNHQLSDFAIGGRRLGTFAATVSAKASDSSSWVFLGLPGAFYVSGMQNLWTITGLTIGFYFSWRVVAGRLRNQSARGFDWRTGQRSDSVTLPAFLANRFHSDVLRVVSSAITLVFYVVYVGSGFVGAGLMFHQIFDLPTSTGVLLGAATVTIYSCLGGFLATSYTDVLQGCLMFASLAIVSTVAVVSVGGPAAVADALAGHNADIANPFAQVELDGDAWTAGGSASVLVVVVSGLAWGLGYFGQPHILARFMGLRSAASAKNGRRLGLFLSITLLGFAAVVGMLAVVLFGPSLDNPENAYLEMVASLLPPWVAGIFLAGILAAIMSTADSQLVVAATTLSEDFYRAFVNREASSRALVWISRGTVVLVSVIAAIIALRGGTVLDLVSYAWAGFGAAFGPVLLAALYSRRTTWVGALCGMVAGGLTVALYPLVDTIDLYEIVPGFAVGLLGVWVGNRLGPNPDLQVQEQFDIATAPQGVPSHADAGGA